MPRPEIVVAGIPRSGTTMVFRALAGLRGGDTTPKNYTGPILKTHSFHPKRFKGIRLAVFMFGDPVAAVASTRAMRWDEGHFRNCGAEDRSLETTDIFREDALNYERMFDVWMRRQPFDVVALRYETLHANADILAAIAKRPVKLPPYRARKDHVGALSNADLAAAKTTYASLAHKISRTPDIAFRRAGALPPQTITP